jgi:hypothetical protein
MERFTTVVHEPVVHDDADCGTWTERMRARHELPGARCAGAHPARSFGNDDNARPA